MPYEEKIAINNARLFLTKLLIPTQTPKVPRAIRKEAGALLKHYPYPYAVDIIFKHYFNSDDINCPKYFLDGFRNVSDQYVTLYNELWNKPVAKKKKAKRRR